MPRSPDRPYHTNHYRLLAVGVTGLWSSSWVLIRAGLDRVDAPLTFAGMRYAVATAALAGWLSIRGRRPHAPATLRRAEVACLIVLGLVQFAVAQGAQFVAIAHQPLATTSLVLAATPLLVALGGRTIGEPLTARQAAGGGLIMIGAFVYFRGSLGATTIGLVAASTCLVANAGSALGGRRYIRTTSLPMAQVTVLSMGVGALVLLASGLTVEGLPTLSARLVAIVVWLAVVNTAAAFTWWNVCLQHLPAAEIAAINTLMAVLIPVLGWIAFDEALGWEESLGLAIVAGGVGAVSARFRRVDLSRSAMAVGGSDPSRSTPSATG